MIVELALREKFGTTVETEDIVGLQQKLSSKFNGSIYTIGFDLPQDSEIWVTNIHLKGGKSVSTFMKVEDVIDACFHVEGNSIGLEQMDIPVTLANVGECNNASRTTLFKFDDSDFKLKESDIEARVDERICRDNNIEFYNLGL